MTRPASALLVASLAGLVGVAALTGCTSTPTAPTTPTAGGSGPVTSSSDPGTTGDSAAVQPEAWSSRRGTAARSLVTQRLEAAGARDLEGWLASFDPRGRPEQTALFRRMSAMRATAFGVTEVVETVPPVPAAPGSPVEWDVELTGTYRLSGFDEGSRAFSVAVTLRAAPDRPERAMLTGWRATERPQPWDLEGLQVRRSAGSLVLTTGGAARAVEVERRARSAARRVAAVLGRAEPAVWVAPSTDAEAAALLGRDATDLSGVAAATDGPVDTGEAAGADRIVVVPGPWSSLTGPGRDVVMAHELTHATVRRESTRAVPVWLSEGFAEFVAYRGVDLPEARLVAPALSFVRREGLPSALPTDAQLDPASGTLSAAYGLSLLAARELAERHGTVGLVRFYRAAAGAEPVPTALVGDPEGAADHLLRTVLRTDRAALVSAWRQRIAGLVR